MGLSTSIDGPAARRHLHNDWDAPRREGDREFCHWLSEENSRLVEPGAGWYTVRPLDFAIAHAWVDEHIPEGNRPRLHDLLNRVEADPELTIGFSF